MSSVHERHKLKPELAIGYTWAVGWGKQELDRNKMIFIHVQITRAT